ncbi:hypothetical protein M9Y10_020952 [Tritrichomonas musculus]|uniref:F5/8 type C domain-containing protein n=1 Tax=Tritrichomonas musculus TaxID=1915356 RepID=A0ABR2HEZ3_9EUKA
MLNQKIVKSRTEFPDTHYFVYKNRQYPIKISYFKLSSKFFLSISEELQKNNNIDLIDEEIGNKLNLQEETIIHFINYVQHKEIPLEDNNVIPLHYLSTQYDIEDLKEDTKNYISSNQNELAIQILSNIKYFKFFNDDTFENIISDNLEEFIQKEELLTLPIPTLYRILTKYTQKNKQTNLLNGINEFILKSIEQHGREASILLSFSNVDKENIEFIEKVYHNCSKKVQFEFISPSAISALLDVYNEHKNKIIEQDKEITAMSETNQKLTSEISSIKRENENEISSLKEEMASKIETLEKTIKDKNEENSTLKTELEKTKEEKKEEIEKTKCQILESCKRFFSVGMSKEEPGILAQLKDKQKTPFDRLFIASLSSSDIYNLLLPHTDNDFCTTNNGDFFIEFELEAAVTISGVKIFSSGESFPKSFDISVEGETVKSVREARELNGEHKDMTVSFAPIRGRKVRFTQTGPSWDKGKHFLRIKGIELLSTDSKYSRGVFSTLVSESENEDPHKCPVIISAPYFDFNSFHSINAEHNICTYSYENSWFQVELTRGTAVLNGFRLKRCIAGKLRSYKVICTDDSSKPESSWTTLIEINEETENEHEQLDIYEFPHPSPPTRFVRLVQTGKNWDNDDHLMLIHFDLFGSYF